ncbi:hypothetical protein IQ238_28345 [Pleurocapsales cyanobacterium LEGE 06147]|nr:hypothetical protein [Pleurocapsales cyanobacterium LEGE 06147]
MPNHFHGVMLITDNPCRGGSRTAPTINVPTQTIPTINVPTRTAPTINVPTRTIPTINVPMRNYFGGAAASA